MQSRNQLIVAASATLPAELAERFERVPLRLREVLYDVDAPITHAYFPEDCVVSVISVMRDGSAVETATVGNEGFVGLPLFLGVDRTPAQAFAQVPGHALRIPADAFRALLAHEPALHAAIGRYAQALFTQIAQSSACNRLHPAETRCARWLLQTHDRVGGDEFPLTQQFLSQMLGVRRATVNEAAGVLQARGLIEYRYGRVRIVDRAGLEAAACECYAITRNEFDRLVRGIAPAPSPLRAVSVSEGGWTTAGDGAPTASRGRLSGTVQSSSGLDASQSAE